VLKDLKRLNGIVYALGTAVCSSSFIQQLLDTELVERFPELPAREKVRCYTCAELVNQHVVGFSTSRLQTERDGVSTLSCLF